MQLKDTLSMDALLVSPDTTLVEALEKVSDSTRSCLIVVDDEGKPLGIATEFDFTRHLLQHLKNGTKKALLTDIMTPNPECISYHASMYDALVAMGTHQIRHIPVIDDDGKVVDVVSEYVLMPTYRNLIEEQQAIIDAHIDTATEELKEANDQLKSLVMEDPLIHIGNRRAMEVDINFTHENARRMHHTYSVAMLDIDFFKKYNDHYGHQQGDEALIFTAQTLKHVIREQDRSFRYGGEEFALIMPETNMEGAKLLAERIIKTFNDKAYPHCGSENGILTLSLGLATFEPGDESTKNMENWKEVLKRADDALYQAKSAGRNTYK